MDEPEAVGFTRNSIPTLGGIAIFAGVIFSIILGPLSGFGNLQYILCAFIIIFLIVKDDIIPITPYKNCFVNYLPAAYWFYS